MPAVGTDAAPPQAPDETSLDTLRALVERAFEAARASGHQKWQVMTTAVLKNRILQATAREFDERDYGVDSIIDAIRLIPDLVELDETTRPPRVTLLLEAADEAMKDPANHSQPVTSAGRVRPDLWNAVLDYSSPGAFVWDGAKAIRVQEDEVGDRPRFPTISSEDMAQWRENFAAQNLDRNLDDWAARGLGTLALPADLRKPWNQIIKANTLSILSDWFEKQSLELPADLLASSALKDPNPDHADAEELRRFLMRCVAVMKPGELKAVQIPASVAFRARA